MQDRVLTTAFESHATRRAGITSLWLERIMFRVRDAVKFGASRVCPKCNSGPARGGVLWGRSTRVRNDVGIRRAQRRAGKIRADVWPRAWPPGRVTRLFDQRTGAGGPARSLLRQPAQSDGSGDGPAHHQSRAGACERIGTIGDGRDAPGETKITKLSDTDSRLGHTYSDQQFFECLRFSLLLSDSYSGCKKGFKCRSFPMVVTGPWPGWPIYPSASASTFVPIQ